MVRLYSKKKHCGCFRESQWGVWRAVSDLSGRMNVQLHHNLQWALRGGKRSNSNAVSRQQQNVHRDRDVPKEDRREEAPAAVTNKSLWQIHCMSLVLSLILYQIVQLAACRDFWPLMCLSPLFSIPRQRRILAHKRTIEMDQSRFLFGWLKPYNKMD